jgi:hypothetical protein
MIRKECTALMQTLVIDSNNYGWRIRSIENLIVVFILLS